MPCRIGQAAVLARSWALGFSGLPPGNILSGPKWLTTHSLNLPQRGEVKTSPQRGEVDMELVTCDWELVAQGLTRLLGLANLVLVKIVAAGP